MPTGRICVGDFLFPQAEIVLSENVVTYRQEDSPWRTVPLSSISGIDWDDFPFDAPQPAVNEIDFLRQFIANLSPDELEAAIEANIGVDGMHRQGEWVKAALLGMVDG